MSKWISANNKVPQRNQVVLAYNVYAKYECMTYLFGKIVDMGGGDRDTFKWVNSSGSDIIVSHWMYLPEPPQLEILKEKDIASFFPEDEEEKKEVSRSDMLDLSQDENI